MVEAIRRVDLERDGESLLALLDHYACDPMGGGRPLSPEVKQNLIPQLIIRSDYLGVIALHGDKAVGLINAFEGFSTFAAKPLVNIHDVIVASEYRGNGLAQRMMAKVEEIARERGCCKLTLEVLSNNHTAQAVYRKFGFGAYALRPEAGEALFWEKGL